MNLRATINRAISDDELNAYNVYVGDRLLDIVVAESAEKAIDLVEASMDRWLDWEDSY